jgi:hypothetical protein
MVEKHKDVRMKYSERGKFDNERRILHDADNAAKHMMWNANVAS